MMWDWKRPSFKESVTAQWSRSHAPKIYRVLINTLIPLYKSNYATLIRCRSWV